MVERSLKLPINHSFFLFGPRGTGKSSLLASWQRAHRLTNAQVLTLDLLDPDIENELAMRPASLRERVQAKKNLKWVIIDECQKVPALLNVVHALIESTRLKFALTGSSARKLKRGGADLLAGRAFEFHLHPFTSAELHEQFVLDEALRWGTMPGLFQHPLERDKARFLRAYAQTYLREEIVAEQIVRNVDRFRHFLPVAAQANGTLLNFAKMSRQSGVDEKSIARFFEILVDTLLGFYLEPFHHSVRKRQLHKPKFYFFDLGVTRAMAEQLDQTLSPSTSAYGHAFEHFFLLELARAIDYAEKQIRMSYLETSSGAEIDLIVERTGAKPKLVEIKSATSVVSDHYKHLERVRADFAGSERIVVYRGDVEREVGSGIRVLPWRQALTELAT